MVISLSIDQFMIIAICFQWLASVDDAIDNQRCQAESVTVSHLIQIQWLPEVLRTDKGASTGIIKHLFTVSTCKVWSV